MVYWTTNSETNFHYKKKQMVVRIKKHLGAEEAHGAHNPRVRRSKLRDANISILILKYFLFLFVK